MHNCKEAKEQLTELVFDEAVLPAELSTCDECRAEFEALNATLRVTARLRETATPSEDYWIGYHALLREKLFRAKAQRRKERRKEELKPLFAPLRLCVKTSLRFLKWSVPVPIPLAVAAIIVFTLVAFRQSAAPPQSPVVVHVPVEVPVIQEKTVMQVVYREKRPSKTSKRLGVTPPSENTFARSDLPINLTGFKPTEEIKLTVIKGGVPNEK